MKVIVDAMGGDNAPRSNVQGALNAVKKYGVDVVLVGDGQILLECLKGLGVENLPKGLEIVHAGEVITMEDDPATAFRRKKDSSLTVGLELLNEGAGDAFVSAGSTGALLSAATLLTKRVKGIRRAALAPVVPTGNGGAVLIDCGANAECSVEYLTQFAYIGSYYARRVMGLERPRVGLLNIGSEEGKGDQLRQDAYQVLRAAGDAGHLNFIGNIEAKEAVKGGCDVIVTDGFTGNVMLKTIEGVGSFMGGELKGMFMENLGTKAAALLVKKGLDRFKETLNPDRVGGTPFLGLTRPVIKAHGASNARAIENAIRQAWTVAGSGLAEDIEAHIGLMKPER